MRLEAGDRLGPYEIVSQLGAGGMGVVFKARDPRLGRFVAIKVLGAAFFADPEHQRRFAQEARAASALNHPGIVTIYDVATDRGVDFIVMEHIEGATLDQLIGGVSLGVSRTLRYATAAAEALAAAHQAGIVHRDLKPSNIIVTPTHTLKILDFGLAKLATVPTGEQNPDSALTRSSSHLIDPQTDVGRVVGTLAYMSPEQAEGKRVDHRSDIFSFGAVVYEMLTGQRSFAGDSSAATLAAVLTRDPTPPSTLEPRVPRELERIVMRCLRKDPSLRFQSTSDLVIGLDDVKAESSSQSPPAARSRALFYGAAVASVALIAAAAWWRSNPAPAPTALSAVDPTVVPITAFPGGEMSPSFSPDGTQLAFAWDADHPNDFDIYVTLVGGGAPLRLTSGTDDDTAPAWSPDGTQIAFSRRQTDGVAALYVTSPLGGPARKVRDLKVSPTQITWTPDSKTIIGDLSTADESDHLEMVPIAGGTPRIIDTGLTGPGRYTLPALSPNGGHLAFAHTEGAMGVGARVFVLPVDGDLRATGAAVGVTTPHRISGLAWTADSNSVVYSTEPGAGVWRVPREGGNGVRMLTGVAVFQIAVARTGRRLAASRVYGDVDLMKFEESAPPTSVASSTAAEYDPGYSSDAKRIAFISNRSGELALWTAKADGNDPSRLTFDGHRPGSPRWSPDDRWIAFDNTIEDGRARVFVIDSTGGQPRRLTNRDDDEAFPSWSQDGAWIYFRSGRTGRSEIWKVAATGGDPVQITDAGGSTPFESADGKSLYYLRGGGATRDIFVKPLAGGPERLVQKSIDSWNYFPTPYGIYYIPAHPTNSSANLEVRILNERTRQSRFFSKLGSASNGAGFAVSPDGKTVIRAGSSSTSGVDLVLVDSIR